MIQLRWQQVLETHHSAVAWRCADESLTFGQVDQLARQHPLLPLGKPLVAKGEAREHLLATVAALIHGRMVQLVEKDRTQRPPSVPPPDDTFLIKQTVGGSGVRRCQFFTAAQVLADVDRLHAGLRLAETDVVVSAISSAHSYGYTVTVLQTVCHGLPLHAVEQPFPKLLTEALTHTERAFLPGIPALWRAWLTAGLPLERVKRCVSAGSPLTLDLERRYLEQHARKLHNLYGTSETGAVSYDATQTLRTEASDVGSLLPGVTVDDKGPLFIQSDAVGLGYDAPSEGEVFGKGQFRSCDYGELRDGRLHWLRCEGRGINVAGRKVAPDEVAQKLRHALGITGVEVRGEVSRDPERCQHLVAAVDLPPEQITIALKQQACAHLAPWEVPRVWASSQSA